MLGDGPAGRRVDLEGPDDPDPVPAADLMGVLGVDGLEPAEERLEPFLPRFGLEGRPQGRVPAGAGEEAVAEGLDVEPGPAGDDGQASPGGDAAGGGEGLPDKVGGRELDLRPDDVDEMMGDAAAGLGRRLVGADVEAPVDLDRVAAHDLAAEAQ